MSISETPDRRKRTRRKLKTILSKFQKIESDLAAVQVDDVFCCLGTTIKKAGSQEAFRQVDLSLVVSIAEVLRRRGALQFIVISSMGANPDSRVFYSRVKGEMERAVQALGYPCLRIIRPSLLLGHRQEFRLGEKFGVLLAPLIAPLMLGAMRKYRPVQADAVARFMVRVAQEEPRLGVHWYESDRIGTAGTEA